WKRSLATALSHYCLAGRRTHATCPSLTTSLGSFGLDLGGCSSTSPTLGMQ
ncbi:hypothetical protein GW17_00048135, partial [Ensete ventricosum]